MRTTYVHNGTYHHPNPSNNYFPASQAPLGYQTRPLQCPPPPPPSHVPHHLNAMSTGYAPAPYYAPNPMPHHHQHQLLPQPHPYSGQTQAISYDPPQPHYASNQQPVYSCPPSHPYAQGASMNHLPIPPAKDITLIAPNKSSGARSPDYNRDDYVSATSLSMLRQEPSK